MCNCIILPQGLRLRHSLIKQNHQQIGEIAYKLLPELKLIILYVTLITNSID